MIDVRENLRMAVTRSGYKQAVIAERSNLTADKLSSILNLNRKLEANEMFEICNVLGITPNELFSFSNEQPN